MSPDLTMAVWRKSSFSGTPGQECVEIADNMPGVVAVRDSKNPAGGALIIGHDAWRAFVADVKTGTIA